MGKKPPEKIIELMKKHGLKKESLWDCHGSWILLHKAIEQLAGFEGVSVDIELIHHQQAEKMCIVKATAQKGNRIFSSFGEAAPYNNRNTYPIAMAEKRAVDRAVLKALNLHGDVYSEIEADDFQDRVKEARAAKKPTSDQTTGQLDMKGLKGKMKKAAGL